MIKRLLIVATADDNGLLHVDIKMTAINLIIKLFTLLLNDDHRVNQRNFLLIEFLIEPALLIGSNNIRLITTHIMIPKQGVPTLTAIVMTEKHM